MALTSTNRYDEATWIEPGSCAHPGVYTSMATRRFCSDQGVVTFRNIYITEVHQTVMGQCLYTMLFLFETVVTDVPCEPGKPFDDELSAADAYRDLINQYGPPMPETPATVPEGTPLQPMVFTEPATNGACPKKCTVTLRSKCEMKDGDPFPHLYVWREMEVELGFPLTPPPNVLCNKVMYWYKEKPVRTVPCDPEDPPVFDEHTMLDLWERAAALRYADATTPPAGPGRTVGMGTEKSVVPHVAELVRVIRKKEHAAGVPKPLTPRPVRMSLSDLEGMLPGGLGSIEPGAPLRMTVAIEGSDFAAHADYVTVTAGRAHYSWQVAGETGEQP